MIFNWGKKYYTGAIQDKRLNKENDIPFSDIVASASPVFWTEKKSFRNFPVLNQNQSYTCGAFSLSKYLGVLYTTKYDNFIEFSEEVIYQRRYNKGLQGMAMYDLWNIARLGVPPKILTNTQIKTDFDCDSYKLDAWKQDVGKIFSISGEPIYIPKGDIETVASVIQTTGKAVLLQMYFTASEWSMFFPELKEVNLNYNSALHHFVVAVDFTLYNGQKCLVIEDSAHFGGQPVRFISEKFFKNRNVINSYSMNFKFNTTPDMPVFDGSIISFQKCMRSIGLFPTNISFVENLGPITRKACRDFQSKYGLDITGQLDTKTSALLLKMFTL